ncbi:MAG: glycine C-acetyltransferase [Akkermansiaceae bacterium]|nr:glycine C-acetyltransferase [Akkermansiaceae bacterium]MCD8071242.1 glycine C-acetyltransferase [Akkermansiaceae bacterium]
MYTPAFKQQLADTLGGLKAEGLYKEERFIDTPQYSQVGLEDGTSVINMCANNYLGLANNPELMETAREAIGRWGFGMASVRFICGTQTLHRRLEERLSQFLGTESTILYGSCFDANGGLFEALLGPEDAIISDSLNHASIIDGVRLCKAKRYRYENNDMEDLEAKLRQADADGARTKLISTDGVFSMDGIIAQLDKIHEIAAKYNALVHFDESHSTGVLGARGRGTHEHCGLFGKVDITTGTLGKALGGASGGYTSGRREIIDVLRQKSRPYLFSNSVMPAIAATTLKVLDMLEATTEYSDRVKENAAYFRKAMTEAGFTMAGAGHPICPVMLGDAALSQKMSARLLELGVYAMGFFYPVVPKGKARIRTQLSAAHTHEQLDRAVDAFCTAGRELGVIR